MSRPWRMLKSFPSTDGRPRAIMKHHERLPGTGRCPAAAGGGRCAKNHAFWRNGAGQGRSSDPALLKGSMARDGNRQRGVAARGPGCENRMPAGGERAGSNVGVCASIVRVGEKVQHRRIVPEIEVSGREREFQDVSRVPRDPIRAHRAGDERQCLLRDIQDADIAKTLVEQVMDERRGARAHIDQARAGR